MNKWINIKEYEPTLSDRSILMHFSNGSIETVHVEDFFAPITCGEGRYTKRCIGHNPSCTHWMELPKPPKMRIVMSDTWTKASEGLPEYGVSVRVWNGEIEYHASYMTYTHSPTSTSCEFIDDADGIAIAGITYWQPITPPED